MDNPASRYLIFGAGALGSVFGAMLQQQGLDVTYVGRGEHFETAMRRGLRITGIWGEHQVPSRRMKSLEDCREDGEQFPVILLCVKSMHTDESARQASPLLEEDGIMVSIQNGLNNWETIARHVGPERTVGARVIFGAEIPEPGVALVSVYADPVLLGEPLAPVNRDLLTALDRDLNLSGIPTKIVSPEEIRSALWAKVLYNSALNPLSAILGVPYGRLGEQAETREVMHEVLREIFQVMEARGVSVPFRDADDYYRFFMEKQLPATVDHRSSMLQDISRGRPTEIDALNGAISRYAKELNIPTPYNDFLTHLIRFKERFARKS